MRHIPTAKAISLFLTTLMLWHWGGLRVYAQARAVEGRRAASADRLATLSKPGDQSHFDELLSQLKKLIKQSAARTSGRPEKGFAGIERLTEIKGELEHEDQRNQKYFGQLEARIRDKNLGGEILNRHLRFVDDYHAKYEALMTRLGAIEQMHATATGFFGKLTGASRKVDFNQPVAEAISFLDENALEPKLHRSGFDPHSLPHRSLKADHPIQPKLTRAEWDKALAADFADSKGATSKSGNSNAQPSSLPADSLTTSPAISSTSPSASSLPIRPLGTASPTPADLAETIEVKFTPEIRALADSLDKNPVKIYNWVHDNVEFLPTWGSIQGAQLCMDNRAGNAFDTASLLIALLRYSGIPARYQMGTIEVSTDKFMNWAGGFTNAEAAAAFFANGGIPSVVRRLNQNGSVTTIRMEHIWVKAFVDYSPSGAAVNQRSNTWVELDPSYKQHLVRPPLDFENLVPSNGSASLDHLLSNGTYDSSGSLTGVNSGELNQFFHQTNDQRLSYLQANLPNISVAEVIGGKAPMAQNLNLLPGATPYRVLIRSNQISSVPDGLRHKIKFELGSNPPAPDLASELTYSASLPELAEKNVLLIYSPASVADGLAALESQPLIPSSVNLVPQLFCGGQLSAAGQPLQAGTPVVLKITFSSPTISTAPIINYEVAGETAAIGLDLQGVPRTELQDLRHTAESIATDLRQGTFRSSTNGRIAEAVLSSSIIGWFASVDENNKRISSASNAFTVRYPSAGISSVKARVTTAFGAPAYLNIEALSMDVDRDIVLIAQKNGSAAQAAVLSLMEGATGSALEADVPLALLTSPDHPGQSIATTHALSLANNQGIPVFFITPATAPGIIPQLQIDAGDLQDIQDAINSGLSVMVSQRPVLFGGRNVLGIILEDPVTGSASFLISQTNGAILIVTGLVLVAIILEAAVSGLELAVGAALFAPEIAVFLLLSVIIAELLTLVLSENVPFFNLPIEVNVLLTGGTGIASVAFLLAAISTLAGPAGVPAAFVIFVAFIVAISFGTLLLDVIQHTGNPNPPPRTFSAAKQITDIPFLQRPPTHTQTLRLG